MVSVLLIPFDNKTYCIHCIFQYIFLATLLEYTFRSAATNYAFMTMLLSFCLFPKFLFIYFFNISGFWSQIWFLIFFFYLKFLLSWLSRKKYVMLEEKTHTQKPAFSLSPAKTNMKLQIWRIFLQKMKNRKEPVSKFLKFLLYFVISFLIFILTKSGLANFWA